MTTTLTVIGPAPIDQRAEQLLVSMRDGVRLATDIYLPQITGPFPTVLVRLPYDKSGRYTFQSAIAAYLTAHGFAVASQDVRGKFRSEGDRMPFMNEAADGYDTIEWLTQQDWCDGSVGMIGDSYYGFTQWAAASTNHPALKAIVPRVTGSMFLGGFADSAVPHLPLYEWVHHTFAAPELFEGPVIPTAPTEGLSGVAPEVTHVTAKVIQLSGWLADGSITERVFGGNGADTLRIPALHTGGWWDNLQRYQLDDWQAVQNAPAADHQYLRMNHTDHEDFELRELGELHRDHEIDDSVLPDYMPRLLSEPISFLRHYLGGAEGRWQAPRVEYQIANGQRDVADRWPPLGVRNEVLHLTNGTSAIGSADGGRLSFARSDDVEDVVWFHDPHDPVPYLVENDWGQLGETPDEAQTHVRADVLTFTSRPQAANVDIVGPVTLEVEVGADSPSAHLIARLTDVYPNGIARPIVGGATLLDTADGQVRATVRLGDTAYRLRPGHRLRLAISGSCYPLYAVHPGTDERPLYASEFRSFQQRITVGGGSGAVLRLPTRGVLEGAEVDWPALSVGRPGLRNLGSA